MQTPKTTLWDVLSALQTRFERRGWAPEAVDSAIVRGVAALVERQAPPHSGHLLPC